MKNIWIPLYSVAGNECSEVNVRIPGAGQASSFRIGIIDLEQKPETGNLAKRMKQMHQANQSSDSNGELLQIQDTPEGVGFVHLLFRLHS